MNNKLLLIRRLHQGFTPTRLRHAPCRVVLTVAGVQLGQVRAILSGNVKTENRQNDAKAGLSKV